MSGPGNALELFGVSAAYGDGRGALSSVSFQIKEGEPVALVGANGAGKTSLFLAVTGLLPLTAGSIRVAGIELGAKTAGEVRRRVGMVFQNPDDQLFMPTVYEDVAFGPRNFGTPEPEIRPLVEGTLGRLGIARLAGRSPLKLSGGEKRLCALAAVLAMRPAYLLLDEPTAFLDLKSRRALIDALGALPQAKLIATHDLPLAASACSRALLLRDGRCAEYGALDAAALRDIEAALLA